MLNNAKEIQNVCDKLGIKYNGVDDFEIKTTHDLIGNLGIIPVTDALKITKNEMVQFTGTFQQAVLMMKKFHTSQKDRKASNDTLYNQIKFLFRKYNTYTKLIKANSNNYVFVDFHKTEKGMFPSVTDVTKAFFNRVHTQLNDLKNVQGKAKLISNHTDAMVETDNYALGHLAKELDHICSKYADKYQDFQINGSDELAANMVEQASTASKDLASEIGTNSMSKQRKQFAAKDYDYVMNNCDDNPYIEDRGDNADDSQIKLLQPDTIGQIADDVADEASNRINTLNKVINKAKSNLAIHEID